MSENRNAPILKAQPVDLLLTLRTRLFTFRKPRFNLLLLSTEGFRRKGPKIHQIRTGSGQGLQRPKSNFKVLTPLSEPDEAVKAA